MKRIIYFLGLVIALGLVTLATSPQARSVAAEDEPHSKPGTTAVLRAEPKLNPYYVPPPPGVTDGTPRRADALPIAVVYNPPVDPNNPTAGCPPIHPDNSNWKLQNWPSEAVTAMNTAALIWSTLLNGQQPVTVNACWYSTLGPNTLGQAKSYVLYSNFTNAPIKDTWYPVAEANQLANTDLNQGLPEIRAEFSGSFYWHFPIDEPIPPDLADPADPESYRYDFLSVALHEIGHGLGFSGSAAVDDGMGDQECDGTAGHGCITSPPRIYDRFAWFGSTYVLDFTDPQTLGSALRVNQWFFKGTNTNAANGNAPARLYAPATWSPGSSFSHLDDGTFDKTPNALMTSGLNWLEVVHHPGPVALGVLADIGWSVNDRSFVYVDRNFTGDETGAKLSPYNTVREGAAAVTSGGTVWITSGTYTEELTISRPMWLKTTGGTVTIGQ